MNQKNTMKRRNFLRGASASVGMGLIAATSKVEAGEESNRLNHRQNVWIASITQDRLSAGSLDGMLRKVIGRMEETLPSRPDIICLPEVFPYHGVQNSPPLSEQAETVPGPITERFADFAKTNQCYVICPFHTKENGTIYNSAVLIDRKGKVVGAYHKIHPTAGECESGVMPGPVDPPVFETDFGTIAMQICFDVNWHDAWHRLRKKGAEIIFWPSAFPGGRMHNAMAWISKAHIVTSTWNDPCRIIDITGDEIAASGRYEHWVCAPVNLEKAIIHTWPYTQNIHDFMKKYGRQAQITRLHDEGWTVIESVSLNIPLKEALEEFEIPTHTEHIQQGDEVQNKHRRT